MYLAMKEDWRYKNFTIQEMACKCNCGLLPRGSFMEMLQLLRDRVGFPIIISSGARCPKYSNSIGSKSIVHSIGASDLLCYGDKAYEILEEALYIGFTGIGISQQPNTPLTSRYIHLDNVKKDEFISTPRPRVWSY